MQEAFLPEDLFLGVVPSDKSHCPVSVGQWRSRILGQQELVLVDFSKKLELVVVTCECVGDLHDGDPRKGCHHEVIPLLG